MLMSAKNRSQAVKTPSLLPYARFEPTQNCSRGNQANQTNQWSVFEPLLRIESRVVFVDHELQLRDSLAVH